MVKKKYNLKASNLWKRAKKLIPGGNMLLSKRPEMFLPDEWPTYFSKSKACYVWGLNNRRYIDVSLMGVGTNILGYADASIDKKVKEVIYKGNLTTLNCPEEVELANKLVSMHPFNGMVKFARTGGEACSIAIRIARAHTKKELVLACGYHGWHDWYLASNIKNDKNLNSHLLKNTSIGGVPSNLKNTIQLFEYNKINEFKKKIYNKKNIACVIMEVSRNFAPSKNFLEEIRKITFKKGIVLIFDECTSGFRETYGGLHQKFKIVPDIVLYGKAIGNGYPITAVVGKKNIMQAAQTTFISSTFWTDRIGPTAAIATLDKMKKKKSWKFITDQGRKIKKKWHIIFKKYDFEVQITGLDALPAFKFLSKKHLEFKTYITKEMLKRGYLASNTIYLSTSHTNKILKNYLKNFETVIKNLSKIKKRKKIVKKICHSEMRRLN